MLFCPLVDNDNENEAIFSDQVSGGASTPEVSLDEQRKQKHVSFDASSLMRSQTIATMDESSYNRTLLGQQAGPSHSSAERLIDKENEGTAYSLEMLPPELARQLMMGNSSCSTAKRALVNLVVVFPFAERLKRGSMRTQATQTDVNKQQSKVLQLQAMLNHQVSAIFQPIYFSLPPRLIPAALKFSSQMGSSFLCEREAF